MSAVVAVVSAPVSRRTWAELGYVLATLVPAAPPFALALAALVATPLSLVGVGLPLVAAALLFARRAPGWFRPFARRMLGWSWPSPGPVAGGSARRVMAEVLRDGAAWRALLYCLVKFPLTAVVAYLSVVAVVVGLFAVTSPAWWYVSPSDWPLVGTPSWGTTWLFAVQGAMALLVFPWFLRLGVRIDRALAHALLAPSRDRERVAVVERKRAILAADATALLRRLERDLHDGTQARLTSVGLLLARLEPRLSDPDLRDVVATARRQVAEGLDELRDLIRGIHPPALDHGLSTALATVAARSPVATEFVADPEVHTSDAVATALYFAASELLTNVTRHAQARRARLHLGETGDSVVLSVCDNGRGGARAGAAGSGLAGLRRRAEALDGSLSIVSPEGGPTTVSITIPRS